MKKFIAGIIVACLLEPATTLMNQLAEWGKSTISIKIMENSVKINELDKQINCEPQNTKILGFLPIEESEGEREDGE